MISIVGPYKTELPTRTAMATIDTVTRLILRVERGRTDAPPDDFSPSSSLDPTAEHGSLWTMLGMEEHGRTIVDRRPD